MSRARCESYEVIKVPSSCSKSLYELNFEDEFQASANEQKLVSHMWWDIMYA